MSHVAKDWSEALAQPRLRACERPSTETVVDLAVHEDDQTNEIEHLSPDPRTLPPGAVLAGRYQIGSCIGRGGMATIYRARQLSLGRDVAVKVLHRRPTSVGLARFSNEASLTAKIDHDNVVDVLDLDATEQGMSFIVMELLEGEDLHARLHREGPLSWSAARELILQICAGLEAAHAVGIVHRDLKPANCFCVDGVEGARIKLLDFGVAKPSETRKDRRLTVEHRVLGTPEYMSPEQAQGELVDGRSDVYAVGVILGELLTGRVPFEGKTAHAVIAAQIYEAPPRLQELAGEGVTIHPVLEAIYARALSKNPDDRFESITAMAEAIAAVSCGSEVVSSGSEVANEALAVAAEQRPGTVAKLGSWWDLVSGVTAYALGSWA